MRRRGLSPINRAQFNWRRLWGEPIGWVWLSAFLLHLVALFCVQDFVFFKGMSTEAHGLFIAQSLLFPESEKIESNVNSVRELEVPTAPSKLTSPPLDNKKVETKIVDVPQWNPLAQLPSGVPQAEIKEEESSSPGSSGVKIWELKSPVKKVIFLIDVSGTMWKEIEGKYGYQLAQEEVMYSIKRMPPEIFFNIIYYSDSTSMMAQELIASTPENKELARRFLKQKPTLSGATDFFKGLQVSFEQRPESIFIFTDGETDIPRWKIQNRIDELKEKVGRSIPLFGIGFFYEKNQESLDILQKICFITGGDFKLYLSYSPSIIKTEKQMPVK